MAVLVVVSGLNPGQRYVLDKDRTVLGRNPDCDVVISGHAVSRQHAQVLRIQGKFIFEDLGSRNGTEINGQRISGRAPLHNNDQIKICDFICAFHEAPPFKPLPPELRREEPDSDDDADGTSTYEATVGRMSTHQLLDSQPAEKLKALVEISANLSRTLELESLLPKIADNLFQLFRQADRCFLIVQEGAKLIPKMIKTTNAKGETSVRFSRSIIKQCLEMTQAFLSEDASTDSRFGLAQSIADFRIRSVMCAPLCGADGTAFGVIQLDTQDRLKRFTADDLKLLVSVANQAAIAMENAKLHEDQLARERLQRDLALAREVQRGFLPQKPPEVAGYDFFAHYEAAQQIGGDYYDFIPLQPGRLAVMLGDVAGKGVPAALLMAKLSAEARFCMLTEPKPAIAVSKLNTMLLQAGLMDRFVTLAGAVLDPGAHLVTIVNAGHPAPLVYRHATRTLEESISNAASGLPLGVADGFEYESATVELRPGDCVLFFTDGVTDAMNTQGVQFQMSGIESAARGGPHTVSSLASRIVQAVRQHSLGRQQFDDITLVCFGRRLGIDEPSRTDQYHASAVVNQLNR